MSYHTPGFEAAQAAYDARLPAEPGPFVRCPEHEESFEDCWDLHEDPEKDHERVVEDALEAYLEGIAEQRAEARKDPDW